MNPSRPSAATASRWDSLPAARLLFAFLLATGLLGLPAFSAQGPASPQGFSSMGFPEKGPALRAASETRPPPPLAAASPAWGTDLAKTISQVTGVAISPLLGTSAVGAWRYFETPRARRTELPWFAQPWFWIPALLLVGLAFAKDALGPVTPTALKKPLDVAEVLENKVSGLVAVGAFVPLVVGVFGALPGTNTAGDLAGMGWAAATPSALVNTLLTPFAMIAFVVVWLLGHVINVLILLSPFTTVDTVLKLARTAVLGTLVGTSFVDERLGLVWAFAIILVGTFLAGWSFRLTVLGSVFLWDVLSRRRRWFRPHPEANWAFLARDIGDAPLRTLGKIRRLPEGRLCLRYRPFLLGKPREVLLPEGPYCLGRGLIYADLLKQDDHGWVRYGILPPRFKGHEDTFTQIYRLEPPTDVGLRAVLTAIRDLLGFSAPPHPERSA